MAPQLFECVECERYYFTGQWEDELYCFDCYHAKYPCPWWCPEAEDWCAEIE